LGRLFWHRSRCDVYYVNEVMLNTCLSVSAEFPSTDTKIKEIDNVLHIMKVCIYDTIDVCL